ncbi:MULTISPECIES: hypothetical protein [Paracoccus]|uniref:hypothetical protein n=1 Tax=Paracoccus TaxID=265 RepID=UPI001E2F8D11|nr:MULTISPECIES: hypothetical protein [Paracoccus]UFS64370.1 hypothetical protein LO749_09335 [Paracoccus denitrificans]
MFGMQERFRELHGGIILDTLTGIEVARANVRSLDTITAHRVVAALIDGLHREFGPRPGDVPPRAVAGEQSGGV